MGGAEWLTGWVVHQGKKESTLPFVDIKVSLYLYFVLAVDGKECMSRNKLANVSVNSSVMNDSTYVQGGPSAFCFID